MKINKSIIAVIAAAMCLTACGRVDDFGKKDENATLTTTTAATEPPVVTDAPEDTTVSAEDTETETETEAVSTVLPETTEPPASTRSKVTTKATTTTTTAATTTKAVTTTTSATTTAAPEPHIPDDFSELVKVNYDGTVFGVGDVWENVEKGIGEQVEESRRVFNNDNPEDFEDEYYYYNLIVKVKKGQVISLTLDSEFYFNEAVYPYTVGGISRYSEKADVENAYTRPTSEDGDVFNYDGDGVYMQVIFNEEGKASKIWIRE